VDLATGQIPRSTERISNLFEMLQLNSWIENKINTTMKITQEKHKSKYQEKIHKIRRKYTKKHTQHTLIKTPEHKATTEMSHNFSNDT